MNKDPVKAILKPKDPRGEKLIAKHQQKASNVNKDPVKAILKPKDPRGEKLNRKSNNASEVISEPRQTGSPAVNSTKLPS